MYYNYKNHSIRLIGRNDITTHILVHYPDSCEWINVNDALYDYDVIE